MATRAKVGGRNWLLMATNFVKPFAMRAQDIEIVRGFSRRFTKRLGLLEESPYDAELNLVESRVVYELFHQKKACARDLRQALGVDKGYLSRVLRGLRRRQLIRGQQNPKDAREKWLCLSPKGEKAFARINQVSEERTQGLLRSLGKANGRAFAAHLSAAEIAIGKPLLPEEIELRGLESGDLGWVISRHGEVYRQEHGWNMDFELLVGEIALGFAKKHDPAKERAWIAHARGVRLGCIFLVKESEEVAKLRILLVEPVARGLGLGRRLVKECLRFAEKSGYAKVVLWTNDVLHAARKIYEAEGFELEKVEAHESFGKKLMGQYWAKKFI
jgi:DNA-binding MarR family transcriptional regulator/N-acetylglutamate synthase-like GNAT family acetyltransferase